MSVKVPTDDQAYQFALMLKSGLPAAQAIRYFLESETQAQAALATWLMSRAVSAAQQTLNGGRPWQELDPNERIRLALDLHYAQLAFHLFSHSYADAVGADRAKMDTCRETLERKTAGTSGQSPLDAFWSDIRAGVVKLPAARVN